MSRTLFRGGRIHVGDGTSAEALLAHDGRVAAAGPLEDVRREASGAEVVDLRGGLMVPGWCDAHVHFVSWARQRAQLDLREAASLDDALALLDAHARALPSAAWIVGGRFDKNRWGRWPTAAELDRVSGGRPAVLRSRDGHARWVNTTALARAGITRDTPAPDGGAIPRDARGEPTGILMENANRLVDALVPEPTENELLAAARLGQDEAWRRGLTAIETLDDFGGHPALGPLERMRAGGELGLRVLVGIPRARLEDAIALGLRSGLGDDWLRLGHLKLFADGALGSQTAALEEPYEGRVDSGILRVEPSALARDVGRAAAAGLAVAIHAIGDRAVRVALDAIASARDIALSLPHRIEHAQLVGAADLERFGRIGAVASMQPLHATSDRDLADMHWGPRRVGRAYPWRALLDSGATLAFGSDAPVEPIDPLLGIHAAVARRRPADATPWTPAQRLTLDQALDAYGRGAGRATGRERDLGTLRPGMRFDATVVDRDLARCSESELLAATVRATITDGVVRFADGLG